ncbi:hypothetical protein ABPG74_001938 [Tetrahymena malaccensis]
MFKLLQPFQKKLNFTLNNYKQQRAQVLRAFPYSFTYDNKQLLKSQFVFKNQYSFSQRQKNKKDRSYKRYGTFDLQDDAEKKIFLVVGSVLIALTLIKKYIDQNKHVGIRHIEKYKKETDQIQKLEYAQDLIELQKSFTLEELKYIEGELKENNFLLLSIIQSQIAALLLTQPKKGGYLEPGFKQQNQDQLNEGQDYVEKSFKNLCQVIQNNSQNDFNKLQNLSKQNKSIHEVLTRIIVDILINLKCTQNKSQKKQFISIFKDNARIYPQLAYKIKQFY